MFNNTRKLIQYGSRYMSTVNRSTTTSIMAVKPRISKATAEKDIDNVLDESYGIVCSETYSSLKPVYLPMLVNNDVKVSSTFTKFWDSGNRKDDSMNQVYTLKYPIYKSLFNGILKPKKIAKLTLDYNDNPMNTTIHENDDIDIIPSKSLDKIAQKINKFVAKEAKYNVRDICIDNGVKYIKHYRANIDINPSKHTIVHYPFYYLDAEYVYIAYDRLTGLMYFRDRPDEDDGVIDFLMLTTFASTL